MNGDKFQGLGEHRQRMPSVDEALQLTPLTSIVPFDVEIIPPPTALPPSIQSSVLNSQEAETLGRQSRALNHASKDDLSTSTQLARALQTTRDLLHSVHLTKYKFKAPPFFPTTLPVRGTAQPKAEVPQVGNELSSLAIHVLNETNVAYRPPEPAVTAESSRSHVKRMSPTTGMVKSKSNGHPMPGNCSNPTTPLAHAPPQDGHSSQGGRRLAYIQIEAAAPMENMIYISPADMKDVVTTKQSRPSTTSNESPETSFKPQEIVDTRNDPREKSNVAKNVFESLLYQVFHIKGKLDADPAEIISEKSQQYFEAAEISGQPGFIIAPETQTKLLNALSKVINLGILSSTSTKDLVRLQRLCQLTQSAASGLALGLPESDAEDEIDAWAERLKLADNNLRASRTIVKVMLGRVESKELLSEHVLRSLLQNAKSILTDCIIPIIEARPSGKSHMSGDPHTFFSQNDRNKSAMTSLLRRAGGLLKTLGDLVLQVDISEESIATIEMLCVQLLFVENATAEKDSVLGISSFEDIRRHGMELLAKVFLRYSEPSRRRSILNEILASLEKLPVGRQSARQFKVVNGKPIQVVSALVMLLVQISATNAPGKNLGLADAGDSKAPTNGLEDHLSQSSEDELADSDHATDKQQPRPKPRDMKQSSENGESLAASLFDSAKGNANYIVNFLLSRAQKVSKSSDEPFRNLLDIFTEDLVSVLGHTDWPASELLLHHLFAYLGHLATEEKTAAPVKVMSLELLGSVGSGIADVQSHVARSATTIEADSSDLDADLVHFAQQFVNTGLIDVTEASFEKIMRAVLHFIPMRDPDSLQLQSARGLFLASRLIGVKQTLRQVQQDDSVDNVKAIQRLSRAIRWLSEAVLQPSICDNESGLAIVTTAQGHVGYALAILASTLGKSFASIINVFVNALRSPHASVKSRALKSVVQLLERNPQILETSTGVVNTAMSAATDTSPSVRDSALTLLSKCVSLKPSLDAELCRHLLDHIADPSTAVRKKQLKLFTEIYLRNEHKAMRAAIASAILTYVGDNEASVSEMAKTTLEEIWMVPFHHAVSGSELAPEVKNKLRSHAVHIVETAKSDSIMPEVLQNLMRELLRTSNKKATMSEQVCKAIIKIMFDGIIDNEGSAEFSGQSATLYALTIFAKASPALFGANDMITLRPYVEHLTSDDDRAMFRSVLVIYQSVLPVLPPLDQKFLEGVQQTLLQSVSKLGKAELWEVAPCLWMISGVLNDTPRLAQFTLSILRGITSATNQNLAGESKETQALRVRTQRYIRIAGPMGKAFDLDGQQARFKEQFKNWTGQDIPELMIDVLAPFLSKKQPDEIRQETLQATTLICQAWPHTFLKPQVIKAFEFVFKDQDRKAEQLILDGILQFFEVEEARSKSGLDIPIGDGAANGAERLGKSLGIASHDSAATSLAERFLENILQISRRSLDNLALTATLVVASINRQGLVHPKQCGSALVVLETSPNPAIAKAALDQHRDLHMKHESMLGKEYVQAIAQAFQYQKNTVQDTAGVNADSIPKLKSFFDVIKAGTVVSRRKLYTDIAKKLDFNSNKSLEGLEKQLPYSRFVIENFALADFARLDEIVHLYAAFEKVFTDRGNAISASVEELLSSLQNTEDDDPASVNSPSPEVLAHLRQMTVATIILTMIWEACTFLRRTWSLPVFGNNRTKLAAKDASRAPTRSSNSSPEAFLKKIGQARYSLRDHNTMAAQCRSFLEMLSIDNDHKAASDEDDANVNAGERLGTPTEDASGSPERRKRKMSASSTPGGRMEKKQRSSLTRRNSGKTSSYKESDEDDFVDDI